MTTRALLLLAALPFVLGVAIGATAAPVGVATAEQAPAVSPTMPMGGMAGMAGMSMDAMAQMHDADPAAMDEMHAAMAGQMPADLREACDEMHAAMAGGEMPMPMGGDLPAGMSDSHAAHHS